MSNLERILNDEVVNLGSDDYFFGEVFPSFLDYDDAIKQKFKAKILKEIEDFAYDCMSAKEVGFLIQATDRDKFEELILREDNILSISYIRGKLRAKTELIQEIKSRVNDGDERAILTLASYIDNQTANDIING